jgi:prolyl 4-hydroxylase
MKTHVDQSWKNWIQTNLDAGQNKDGIFKILFDEGGRLKHERPQALDGNSFANIFCHFKPLSYVPNN